MQALGLVWRDVGPIAPDCREQFISKAALEHHCAKLTWRKWQERRSDGGFAIGRDLPSRALAPALRSLAVLEPVDDGRDFRVRVAGMALVRRYECDVTGLMLSQLYEKDAFVAHRAGLHLALGGAPQFFDVEISHKARVLLRYEALQLPVLSPDRGRTWVLSGYFYPDWTR